MIQDNTWVYAKTIADNMKSDDWDAFIKGC